jgi:cytochrome c-type biogenesis protein CcmE
LVVLGTWAVTSPGALSYYKTPSELGDETSGRTLRVGGRVADLERDGSLVTFDLSDGHEAVRVVYRGDVPDTLKNSTDAVAEGSLRSDGSLYATRVQAKCSSKFVSEEDAPEHLGRT